MTGSTRSDRRRGLFDKPLALLRAQPAVIDVVCDSSKSHEDKRIALRTEYFERKTWNAYLSTRAHECDVLDCNAVLTEDCETWIGAIDNHCIDK